MSVLHALKLSNTTIPIRDIFCYLAYLHTCKFILPSSSWHALGNQLITFFYCQGLAVSAAAVAAAAAAAATLQRRLEEETNYTWRRLVFSNGASCVLRRSERASERASGDRMGGRRRSC